MLTAKPIFKASKLSFRKFRDTVGTNTKTLNKALDNEITIRLADSWCNKLDLHPSEVYGITVWLEALEKSNNA